MITPDDIKQYAEAATPVLNWVLLVAVIVWSLMLLQRVPWMRFYTWLSAPSITSLVFVSAFCISAQTYLSDESAYKYVNPYLLFSLKFLFGCFGAGFIAIKALRIKPPEPSRDEAKDAKDKPTITP